MYFREAVEPSYRSCATIIQLHRNAMSGYYMIDVDEDRLGTAQQAFCDMDTDNGGYTLVMNQNADECLPNSVEQVGALNSTGSFRLASVKMPTNPIPCILNSMSWCL